MRYYLSLDNRWFGLEQRDAFSQLLIMNQIVSAATTYKVPGVNKYVQDTKVFYSRYQERGGQMPIMDNDSEN